MFSVVFILLLIVVISGSKGFNSSFDSVKSSKDQEENKKQRLTNSECGMGNVSISDLGFRIWDCFNLGFGIADFGLY